MSQVTVTAKDGQVVVPSTNNPDYGYIRVEQTKNIFTNSSGRTWLRQIKLSALILGEVEQLRLMGYRAGQTLPGQIVIRESLDATNPENPMQDIKINPDTKEVLMLDGQKIYRTSIYTENPNEQYDILVQHNEIGAPLVQTVSSAEAVKADN